uniref:Uncharacterized protein n=1 Tax=Cannabis sativa TaxID=3483 RepID=A0A803Q7J8_CANSA
MFSNSLRGRLVDRLPFPDTKEALFEVRLEEARRHVMLTHSECHGHSRSTCWEIHGKPAKWTPRRPSGCKAYQAHDTNNPEILPPAASSPFSKEQLDHLHANLNQSSQKSSSGLGLHSASCSGVHCDLLGPGRTMVGQD